MNIAKGAILSVVILAGMVQQVIADTDKSADDWHFSLAPLFLWGMGIQGSTTFGTVVSPLDIEFKDALDNMEAVFTFHFEAQKKDLNLFAEYQYVDMRPSSQLPNGSKVDIDFKNTMAELGAAYRVARFDRTDFEVLGGARYVEQELNADGIPLPPISSLNSKESWWDAIIGGRTKSRLSENWSFIGRADYGFGGSDGTWNLVGMFDYRFKGWGSAFAGYKWMDFDYSTGSGKNLYEYNATQQGPVLGLRFYW